MCRVGGSKCQGKGGFERQLIRCVVITQEFSQLTPPLLSGTERATHTHTKQSQRPCATIHELIPPVTLGYYTYPQHWPPGSPWETTASCLTLQHHKDRQLPTAITATAPEQHWVLFCTTRLHHNRQTELMFNLEVHQI